jgi:hypothetical protein
MDLYLQCSVMFLSSNPGRAFVVAICLGVFFGGGVGGIFLEFNTCCNNCP